MEGWIRSHQHSQNLVVSGHVISLLPYSELTLIYHTFTASQATVLTWSCTPSPENKEIATQGNYFTVKLDGSLEEKKTRALNFGFECKGFVTEDYIEYSHDLIYTIRNLPTSPTNHPLQFESIWRILKSAFLPRIPSPPTRVHRLCG